MTIQPVEKHGIGMSNFARSYFGKKNFQATYSFATQLIYDDGDIKAIKGTWTWEFAVTFEKQNDGSYKSEVLVAPNEKPTWEQE